MFVLQSLNIEKKKNNSLPSFFFSLLPIGCFYLIGHDADGWGSVEDLNDSLKKERKKENMCLASGARRRHFD